VPTGTYDRYGLTGNPFRELSSESLDNVSIYHVNQDVDETLRTIRDEVFEKENRVVAAVTGDLGAGKTERLLVTLSEARERKVFTVYFDITSKTPWVLRGLASQFQKSAKSARLIKFLGGPPWLRPVAALTRTKDERYDPREAGRILGAALNATAPSALLLNDLQSLVETKEIDSFASTLQEICDVVKPGVLVMFTCFASYLAWLAVNHPALVSRINRTIVLKSLTDDEAGLLLAKKLLVKRLVEDLDPIYPFDRQSIHELNGAAHGNPRRLLELADLAVEYGVSHRTYRVDTEVVRVILGQHQAPQIASEVLRGTSPAVGSSTRTPATSPQKRSEAAVPPGTPAWAEPK
jgi:hypothetical protein